VIISGSGVERKLAFAAELATTVDASMLGAIGPRRVDLRRPPSAGAAALSAGEADAALGAGGVDAGFAGAAGLAAGF
jgi:hypothetical protein